MCCNWVLYELHTHYLLMYRCYSMHVQYYSMHVQVLQHACTYCTICTLLVEIMYNMLLASPCLLLCYSNSPPSASTTTPATLHTPTSASLQPQLPPHLTSARLTHNPYHCNMAALQCEPSNGSPTSGHPMASSQQQLPSSGDTTQGSDIMGPKPPS